MHESLTELTQGNSSGSMQNTGFVKASQLVGKKQPLVSSSGRSSSPRSCVPAVKFLPAVKHRLSKVSPGPSLCESDVKSSEEASQSLLDSRIVGFCSASKLLPSCNSGGFTTTHEKTVKDDSTPTTTARVSTPLLVLPDSTASANEPSSIVASMKKEESKAKATGRKAKIDPAADKTKKITYFFKK